MTHCPWWRLSATYATAIASRDSSPRRHSFCLRGRRFCLLPFFFPFLLPFVIRGAPWGWPTIGNEWFEIHLVFVVPFCGLARCSSLSVYFEQFLDFSDCLPGSVHRFVALFHRLDECLGRYYPRQFCCLRAGVLDFGLLSRNIAHPDPGACGEGLITVCTRSATVMVDRWPKCMCTIKFLCLSPNSPPVGAA